MVWHPCPSSWPPSEIFPSLGPSRRYRGSLEWSISTAVLFQQRPVGLKGGRKGPEPLTGSQLMVMAFNEIKAALMRSMCLAFPKDTAELTLATDASVSHVGAVLQQKEGPGSSWRLLGFFLGKLETPSSSTALLIGSCSKSSQSSWPARQQQQLSYIAEFTANIVHVLGKLNLVADLMSRPPQAVPSPGPAKATGVKMPFRLLAASQVEGSTAGDRSSLVAAVTAVEGVDLELLAKEPATCPSIQQLRNSSSLQIQPSTVCQQQLWCDVSFSRRPPLVTTS